MTKNRKFSRVKMIQLALGGLSQKDIAKEMNCHKATISFGLKELYAFKRGRQKGYSLSSGPRKPSKRQILITPEVLRLYHEGNNISDIKKKLKITSPLIKKILLFNNLDISRSRGTSLRQIKRRLSNVEKIVDYVEGYGPQHLKPMKINHGIRRALQHDGRVFFIKVSINVGKWRAEKPVSRLSSGRPCIRIDAIAATDDPRIPEWIASQVPWKIQGSGEAAAMMRNLKGIIGREAAAITIVLLGHHYETSPMRGTYTLSEWLEKQQALITGNDTT